MSVAPAVAPLVGAAAEFDWDLRPRVVFGPGRVRELGEVVAGLGDRALLVADAHLEAATPAVATARSSLVLAGVEPVVFAVTPGPSLDRVRAAVARAASGECDVVVGLGGGSTMDVAKCAAMYALQPGLFQPDRWPDRGPVFWPDGPPRGRLPLVQVPTTAATGSEVSSVASIRVGTQSRLLSDPALAADVALVDPELTGSVPVRQAVAGGVETLCRLLCPYLTGPVLLVQDRIAEALMRACVEAVDAVAARPDDVDARAALSLVCTLSMTHVTNLGRGLWGQVLWYVQDALRQVVGLEKGVAMAALLPSYLGAALEGTGLGRRCGTPDRVARVGTTVLDVTAPDPSSAARETVRVVTGWLARHGLPTSLRELGLGSADVQAGVEVFDRVWAGVGDLRGISGDEVGAFLATALGTATDASPPSPAPAATHRDRPARQAADPGPGRDAGGGTGRAAASMVA